jgi:hypothetical protein
VYLPEAKAPATDIVELSHPVDDGDLAFVLRLDRNSMFCTGLKNSAMHRAGLGTAIDPLINLCTVNYILSGIQLGIAGNDTSNLWLELLENLDKGRFGRQAGVGRDYTAKPVGLNDVIHVIRHCIRPFGITRGSEKQGGQDEATISPATWPVSFVVSVTLDGKESNVLNIWHHHDLSAGQDLVLRLKPMPIRQYTLNHYYKGVKRQTWDKANINNRTHVWQLVPDLLSLETQDKKTEDAERAILGAMPVQFRQIYVYPEHYASGRGRYGRPSGFVFAPEECQWQELGFWHIGRSQIMTGKYGMEEYWHNDLANSLRTNHLDITLQPVFQSFPLTPLNFAGFGVQDIQAELAPKPPSRQPRWEPRLGLERLQPTEEVWPEERAAPVEVRGEVTEPPPVVAQEEAPVLAREEEAEPDWLGRLEFTDELASAPAAEEPPAKKPATAGKVGKRGAKAIGGSLLKADGTSEASMVGML